MAPYFFKKKYFYSESWYITFFLGAIEIHAGLLRPRLNAKEFVIDGFLRIHLKSLGLNFINHSLLKSLLSRNTPDKTQNLFLHKLKKHKPLSIKLAKQQNAMRIIDIIAITVNAYITGVFIGENDPRNTRIMLTNTVT